MRVLQWFWFHKWTSTVVLHTVSPFVWGPIAYLFFYDDPVPFILPIFATTSLLCVGMTLVRLAQAYFGFESSQPLGNHQGPVTINGLTYVRGSSAANQAQSRADAGSRY